MDVKIVNKKRRKEKHAHKIMLERKRVCLRVGVWIESSQLEPSEMCVWCKLVFFAHSYHWGAVVLCRDRKIGLIRKQCSERTYAFMTWKSSEKTNHQHQQQQQQPLSKCEWAWIINIIDFIRFLLDSLSLSPALTSSTPTVCVGVFLVYLVRFSFPRDHSKC